MLFLVMAYTWNVHSCRNSHHISRSKSKFVAVSCHYLLSSWRVVFISLSSFTMYHFYDWVWPTIIRLQCPLKELAVIVKRNYGCLNSQVLCFFSPFASQDVQLWSCMLPFLRLYWFGICSSYPTLILCATWGCILNGATSAPISYVNISIS